MRRLLQITLIVLAPPALFVSMIAVDRAFGSPGRGYGYVVHIDMPPAGGMPGLPPIEGPLDASRPLVVIDAGHGGHDPGAGVGGLHEKALTLSLARALHDALLAGGGIRVAMTRADDRYLLLEERSDIARRLGADLFLSIHADSADNDGAHGATLYTLSARGSSEEATRLANAENRADMVNGVTLSQTSGDVGAILVDLSQRRSETQSLAFAQLVLREGRDHVHFRDRPLQSAAFVVLKSPDLPSVLYEAGYISNSEDAARLASAKGRALFATTTAQAIRVYFARQSAAGAIAPAG